MDTQTCQLNDYSVRFSNLNANNLLFWPAGAPPDPQLYLKVVPMPDDSSVKPDYAVVMLDTERERQAEKDFMHRLGALLVQLRGKRQRHEVAVYLGRHHNTIAKFERGESLPDAWEMIRLARFFDRPVEQLYAALPLPPRSHEDLSEEFVVIPEFDESNRPHGPGTQMAGRFAFRRSWLASKGLTPDDCAVATANSDSMESTVYQGDILLVDKSVTKVHVDGIYLIQQGGELRCKRLQPLIDGGVKIRSDNPKYETELVHADQVRLLRVCGKVEWIGGER